MIGPRIVDKPLVLYGYGKLGHLAEEIFNELKIPIAHILDLNKVSGIAIPGNRNKAEYFIELMTSSLLAICVATEPYSQVIAPLVAAGWEDIVPVWDIVGAYPEVGLHNGWFVEDIDMKEILVVDMHFNDHQSRLHYAAHILWRKYRHELNDDELIIDISGPSLPSTLADIRIRQRTALYHDAPMGEINIHEEGCELFTLRANMHLFQKYRPKITCACYHSHDGLWQIEKLLMDSLPNYRWTFRLTAYMGQGAYIYGIPEERL